MREKFDALLEKEQKVEALISASEILVEDLEYEGGSAKLETVCNLLRIAKDMSGEIFDDIDRLRCECFRSEN